MDALYVFRHSRFNDIEIRYSLRSIAQHMPWVRKVWIVGDRPEFLTGDTSLIQHVPHEYAARVGNFRTPVTNLFLQIFLSSLIPGLDHEYLLFCDDFFLLRPYGIGEARKVRYLQDLSQVKNRGDGLWRDSLWRTYDLLKRLKYTGYNFETHTPTYLRRRWVFEAYCDFRDFVSQDRWYGLLGITAILNHAYRHHKIDLVHLEAEGLRGGFWGAPSPDYDAVVEACRGKAFLNFDDHAFGPGLIQFLARQFPAPCRYERADDTATAPPAAAFQTVIQVGA
jgi:hypothetical protein